MKLWLDDTRDPPNKEWAWAKTAPIAIGMLEQGTISEVDLDHDLGPKEAGTGMDVAKWIEEHAFTGDGVRLKWNVHSRNTVGAAHMRMALSNADRYWDLRQEKKLS